MLKLVEVLSYIEEAPAQCRFTLNTEIWQGLFVADSVWSQSWQKKTKKHTHWVAVTHTYIPLPSPFLTVCLRSAFFCKSFTGSACRIGPLTTAYPTDVLRHKFWIQNIHLSPSWCKRGCMSTQKHASPPMWSIQAADRLNRCRWSCIWHIRISLACLSSLLHLTLA